MTPEDFRDSNRKYLSELIDGAPLFPSEGQLLAEHRKSGRDGEFQMHLAKRHMIIGFHKIIRPWAEPLLDWLSSRLNRVFGTP